MGSRPGFPSLLLLPPDQTWCFPSHPVWHGMPPSLGKCKQEIPSMALASPCHQLVTSINEDSVGTNETSSHLIHFSEESLSFQVLRHLYPENVSIPLFTNMQHFRPSCHFQGWLPRLSNKQGCKVESGKDRDDSAHMKALDSTESWEQFLSSLLSQISG